MDVEEESEIFGRIEVVSHPSFDNRMGTGNYIYLVDSLSDEPIGEVRLGFDCTIEAKCLPEYHWDIADAICTIANRFMF